MEPKRVDFVQEHKDTLRSIGIEAESKRKDYSEKGMEVGRKEAFKEVINERVQSAGASEKSVRDKIEVVKNAPKDNKLQELVDYTALHGPISASLIVKKIGDPWLEDQFHDTLVSLHDELISRGKLKEE